MSEAIQDYPVVSIDTHFRKVPGLEDIDFDPRRYAAMLVDLGVEPAQAGSANTVHIRPDYALAYSRWERMKAFMKHPRDYTDAASCVENEQGGVDILLVYGTSHGINGLLRHETHHAVVMLTNSSRYKDRDGRHTRRLAAKEKADADKLMKDKRLRRICRDLVTVRRNSAV